MSNTFHLVNSGWAGFLVECDSAKFPHLANVHKSFSKVRCSNQRITPENVVDTLTLNNVPRNLDLLSIDIDGYDYFVLDKLLGSGYRPKVICAEINEKIPPPIKFSVKFNESYWWDVSHFFGMSISKVEELCEKYNYSLVLLQYNNVFLIAKELSPFAHKPAQQAYLEGYVNRPDRKQIFYYNSDVDFWLDLEPSHALHYINQKFSKYSGMYEAYM